MRMVFPAAVLALLFQGGCQQTSELWPRHLAGGNRLENPQSFNAQTIFDYMDGAAEIYFTYAFRNLTVVPYQIGRQRVTVELYDMQTPAEAFGIFSNDWEGEPVAAAQEARYLRGLLRGWQGPFFFRIQGEQDTPEVKHFATRMARHLASKIRVPGEGPALEAALPQEALQLHRLRYFHQDRNLNSFFYISTENVLALSPHTEGLFAEGVWDKKPVKVLLLQYPTKAERDQGWQGFCAKVLSPQAAEGPAGERMEEIAAGQFAGIRRLEGPQGQPRLALCFEAPSAPACQAALEKMDERE